MADVTSAVRLTSGLVGYFRARPSYALAALALSFVFAAVSIVLLGIGSSDFGIPFGGVYIRLYGLQPIFLGSLALSGYVALCVILSFTRIELSFFSDNELDPIRKEREVIRERVAGKAEPDIFDAVELNLNQLTEYYTINKSQARNSFRASVVAIIVGMVTIVGGVWLFYFQEQKNVNLTYMTVISGILLQFVGGAYFYLHNRSLNQLNFFFARLVTVQDTMLSIKLSELIPDQKERTAIITTLIMQIISRGQVSEPALPARKQRQRKGPPATVGGGAVNSDGKLGQGDGAIDRDASVQAGVQRA